MASRKELLDSIKPEMHLTKNFFLKVFAYEMTTPGFADDVLTRLEIAGCSKALEYYASVTAEWQREHDKEMQRIAEWYRKQNFIRKGDDESRKRQQEVEQQMMKLKLLKKKLQLLKQKKAEEEQSSTGVGVDQ